VTQPLYDTTHCPRVGICESCGTEIDVSTVVVECEIGPYCLRLCQHCDQVESIPQLGTWIAASDRIIRHCEHLGITVQQMEAILTEDLRPRRSPA
jgi:hypothetical protein